MRPTRSPTGLVACPSLWDWRPARSASSCSSTSSRSLRPPEANSLMPLSPNGLCDAEIIAAGWPATTEARATAGVGTMPRSTTSAPSEETPAAKAAARSGPDRRVSRPMRHSVPPMMRAAARPSARASSGVSSLLATPRTPSVPNLRLMARRAPGEPDDPPPVSALRVLRSLAGLLEAVLLGLLGPGVPAEEPGLLQLATQLGVELDEAAGDAEAQGAGLAGGATAVDGGVDVVDLFGLRQAQRLGEDHAVGVRREVVGDVTTVD